MITLEKKILKMLVNHNHPESLIGDYEELYIDIHNEKGLFYARFWIWLQIALLLPHFFNNSFYWSFAMIGNYFKTGFRNIKKSKIYSFINITGLAVGMAAFILIFLWVQDELSYEKFHSKIDNLYRIVQHEKYSTGEEVDFSQSPAPLAKMLKDNYPEIIETSRYYRSREVAISVGDKLFNEAGFAYADPSFLNMFDFPLATGDKDKVLENLDNVIISEEIAIKYFGNENPIGKTIRVNNMAEFAVAGVFEKLPKNTHFNIKFLIPFKSLKKFIDNYDSWGRFQYYTYALINENTNPKFVSEKIKNAIIDRGQGDIATLSLQSLKDVHLYSSHIWGIGGTGDIRYVYIFSLIAFFVLLTACINFMNLSTARSANRSKEVGLRKVIGANRKEIITQFFSESLLLTFIALVVSIMIVSLVLPLFNEIASKEINFGVLNNINVIFVLLVTAFLTGIISGSYPAFFISSFQPANILRRQSSSKSSNSMFRKILVTTQFVLTISLVISAVVINKQLSFMRNQKLGFDKDHIVFLSIKGELNSKIDYLKNEFKSIPGVRDVAASSNLPADVRTSFIVNKWENSKENEQFLMYLLRADYDLINTFNMEMTDGRYFSKEFPSDTATGIVVNEAAVKIMGLENPVGKKIEDEYEIVGVIKDFNFRSLHSEITPLMITLSSEDYRFLSIKIDGSNLDSNLENIKAMWKELVPNYPIKYNFLDEVIESLYLADLRIEKIINIFTVLIIFIACLGLLGLASFTAEQRRKEIGIRKVLGASIVKIIISLTREYVKWILVANFIAWPVTYYLLSKFLQSYAYRIELGVAVFFVSGLLTLVIAILTVTYQSIKAAVANPIDSIKYE